jgi:hypothetical protein
MVRVVELAALVGADEADAALGSAAIASPFAYDDLPSILDHLAMRGSAADVVADDETRSAQPGTANPCRLGEPQGDPVTLPVRGVVLSGRGTDRIIAYLSLPAGWLAGSGLEADTCLRAYLRRPGVREDAAWETPERRA